jgi:apolipoprotein N-acyltransferase
MKTILGRIPLIALVFGAVTLSLACGVSQGWFWGLCSGGVGATWLKTATTEENRRWYGITKTVLDKQRG